MREELHAVDILKHVRMSRALRGRRRLPLLDFLCFSLAVHAYEVGHLMTMKLRPCVAEFLLKGVFQNRNITVLAKHQWNNQPIITRTHLAIAAAIAGERPIVPARYVRRSPLIVFGLRVELGGVVLEIESAEKLAAANRLRSLADQHSIHDHGVSGLQVLNGKLVFCGNIGREQIILTAEFNMVSLTQISKGN